MTNFLFSKMTGKTIGGHSPKKFHIEPSYWLYCM